MREKKRSYGVNVGSSSILLIFVILCLVSFSVLAISSAQADRGLSSRLVERTQNYYAARNRIEEELAVLEDQLKGIEASALNETAYYQQAGREKVIAIPLSQDQNLEARITVLYPRTEGAYFRVESCRVKTLDAGIELDDSLEMYTGDFGDDLSGEPSFALPFFD